MLMCTMKPREELFPRLGERVFVLCCSGCRELRFPEAEVRPLLRELKAAGKLAGSLAASYICSADALRSALESRRAIIESADSVLVLSCGVGVQNAAELLENKRVLTGCDTHPLPGEQGLTPLSHSCAHCGECRLNLTGGICPVTACAKGLLNGPCGGAKDGKCETDPARDCGWERIFRRLEALGQAEGKPSPAVRDYGKGE